MAWYDYVPIASNVSGLIKGNNAQTFGGPVGYAMSKSGEDAANNAANAQRSSLDAAMKRLQEFSQQQYQNRMADLDKTMAFYGPAQRYLESIYSQPGTVPGTGPSSSNGGASRAPMPGPGPSGPPGVRRPDMQPQMPFQGPRRGF